MDDQREPSLSYDEAFRAAFYVIDQYSELETDPNSAIILLRQYMITDPARLDDWAEAVRRAREADWDPELTDRF